MKISDAEMDAAIAEYRGFRTAEEFYQRLNDSPEFLAAIEAAYARGQRNSAQNFMLYDATGWYSAQVCVATVWPDTSKESGDLQPHFSKSQAESQPLPRTEAEKRQQIAKTLVELAVLEAAPKSPAVEDRIAALQASLPVFESVTAPTTMAPASRPQTWESQVWKSPKHAGTNSYSDEGHVGCVEAASGKRSDTFRVWHKPFSEK